MVTVLKNGKPLLGEGGEKRAFQGEGMALVPRLEGDCVSGNGDFFIAAVSIMDTR